MEISESQIIEKCQKGDLADFGLLYDRYIKKIYNYIYWRISDKDTAEDLTSQTFFKALEKINTYHFNKGSFSSWLYRIARNNVIDHYRQQRPTSDIERAWGISANDNLEQELSDRQELTRVEQYLERLSPEQKDVVMMRLWDELSYQEIAEIMGKSEASCKMMFSRVAGRLRQDLAVIMMLALLAGNFPN
ncbi:MAG TPA: RNA polymerase sigma factor [bacterium]|nr:RNA polymerase sigma factor [bacterium]HNS33651.1 RNA polymerase sigma factor [bacterium]HNZ73205.1 RNA polymerase sigma factor [bacterium]HOH67105.1 RNA polymerase sigma factor [bacterium]